jgi:hypothetical protein
MKRLMFIVLALATLLATSLVPSGLFANGDDDEGYLTPEEKTYVVAMRGAVAQARNNVSKLRSLLAMPKVLDKQWYASVSSSAVFCDFPTGFAPDSMQDIDKMRQDVENCFAWIGQWAVRQQHNIAVDLSDTMGGLAFSQELAEHAEAVIFSIELALNERVHEIAEGRRAAAEVAKETGMCFIATAAYCTPAAAEIDVLRQFRDEFLLQNPPGRAFVNLYYDVSPPVADFISEHEVLRTVVRGGFVDPVVNVVKITQDWWAE